MSLGTKSPVLAVRFAYSLAALTLATLERIRSMTGDDRTPPLTKDMFLIELARERDRIAGEFTALVETKRRIQRGMEAAGERFMALLSKCDDTSMSAPISMPAQLMALLGSEAGEGPTALDVALDAANADIQRLAFEQQRVATQLADLARQSESLVLRHEHRVTTGELRATHSGQIQELAAFARQITSHAIAEASRQPRSGSSEADLMVSGGKRLSELVKAFCDYKESTQDRWDPKTAVMAQQRLNLWLRIVGDMPAQQYRAEHNDLYVQRLKQLPSNLNKMPEYRGKSLDEVVALGHDPLSAATVNFNINLVRSLLRWASNRDYIAKVPGGLERVSSKEKEHEGRDAFTDADLSALFETDAYQTDSRRSAHLHWIPLIGLFTGARVNEIAQLRCDDIREGEAVPFFAFGKNHADQREKNAHSNREVPVHPELIRLGLLRYVKALRDVGQEWIFPALTKGRDGHSRKFNREFDAYRRQCGVVDAKKTFHSFRHTFITRLRHADVDRAIVFQMTGHSVKGNAGDRHYTKPFTLEDCLTKGLAALPFEGLTKRILPYCE